LDKVGTPHFAQFVPLEDNQLGFFTVYDGSFDKYIADFTKISGRSSISYSNSPRIRHPLRAGNTYRSLLDFAAGANRAPIGFYQAYPGLGVQDIHALIADSKSQSGPGKSGGLSGRSNERGHKVGGHVSEAGQQVAYAGTKRRQGVSLGVFSGEVGMRAQRLMLLQAQVRRLRSTSRYSGLHPPRLQDADGAAFPAHGGRAWGGTQAARAFCERRMSLTRRRSLLRTTGM